MAIEVILKDHVEHLGERGDTVKVANGYARNYLLPRKLALAVTESNRRQIDAEGAAARHGVFKNGMIVAPPDPKMRGSSAALPRREWFYEKGIGFYLPEILVGDPARLPAPPCPTRSRSQQVPEASYSMVKSNSGNMYFCWLCVKVDYNSFF